MKHAGAVAPCRICRTRISGPLRVGGKKGQSLCKLTICEISHSGNFRLADPSSTIQPYGSMLMAVGSAAGMQVVRGQRFERDISIFGLPSVVAL